MITSLNTYCYYHLDFDGTVVVVDDIVDVADVVDFDVFVVGIEIADFEVEIEIDFVDYMLSLPFLIFLMCINYYLFTENRDGKLI